MEKRRAERYEAGHFPELSPFASVTFPNGAAVESHVIDISTVGMKLKICAAVSPSDTLPMRNDTLGVRFTSHQIQIRGMCVYVNLHPQNGTTMGIFVFNPLDQRNLQGLLDNSRAAQHS